jgi:hypothetical protein
MSVTDTCTTFAPVPNAKRGHTSSARHVALPAAAFFAWTSGAAAERQRARVVLGAGIGIVSRKRRRRRNEKCACQQNGGGKEHEDFLIAKRMKMEQIASIKFLAKSEGFRLDLIRVSTPSA